MKVVIVNQYTENRGDEAAGTALVKNLLNDSRVNQIDIIYNSAFKLDFDHDRVIHHHEDLRLKNVGKRGILQYLLLRKTIFDNWAFSNSVIKNMIKLIKEADLIYVTPCGASIGIYKDWAFLIRLLFVVKESKTPIFCLNTIGRSGNLVFDKLANIVLKFSKLYVREQRSFDYLTQLGLHSELGVDTAFSLEPIYNLRSDNKIGLVVTLLGWHPEFDGRDMSREVLDNIIPAIADFCIKYNLSIDIIPHTGKDDELLYMKQVKNVLENNKMNSESIDIRYDVKTYEDYDMALANMKMVIGMRYHSVVLAAKNAVPFLALAYENKMREVCNYTDMKDYYIDLQETLSYQSTYQKLLKTFADIERIEHTLRDRYENKLLKLSKLPLKELSTVNYK